jgi:SulP family sulfate permease
VTVLLAGVRPDTAGILTNINLASWFPSSQATLKAVRFALAKLRGARAEGPAPQALTDVDLTPKLYYLG